MKKRHLITYTNMLCLNGDMYRGEKKWKKQQKICSISSAVNHKTFSKKQRERLIARIRNRLLFAEKQENMFGVWGGHYVQRACEGL